MLATLLIRRLNNNIRFVVLPPLIEPVGCQSDGECPSKEACLEGECMNPCLEATPCAPENSACTVYDSLPRRTLTCTCKEGFTGKADEECKKISKIKTNPFQFHSSKTTVPFLVEPIEVGCDSDYDCPSTQSCNRF